MGLLRLNSELTLLYSLNDDDDDDDDDGIDNDNVERTEVSDLVLLLLWEAGDEMPLEAAAQSLSL